MFPACLKRSSTGALHRYAAEDVAHLLPLRDALLVELERRRLSETAELENRLLPEIVAIALAGVSIDVDACETLEQGTNQRADEARSRLRSALGIENPNSSQQLLAALPSVGISVNATHAEAMAPYRDHPVAKDLSFVRTAAKIICDAKQLASVARASPDGRVRADWHQLGAPTGRMSTSRPNVLGIPKGALRKCIAAPPGRVLVVADYAAIELRVLAHVTTDVRLGAIFRDGRDPHAELAAILLRKDMASVTPDERKRAKSVNFGFAFGMGAPRFVAYALKNYGARFTEAEAVRFRSAYLTAYPQVAQWQRLTRGRMDLEVRTVSGRIRSFESRTEGYCERLNMPVQGTAADGMKRAIVLLAPRLVQIDARIILAVHDELVVEVPEALGAVAKQLVIDAMIEGMSAYVTTVPIVVEADVRRTWGG